jgi:hypothetical protein
MIRRLAVLIAVVALFGGAASAQTFGGVINDSKCGNKHTNADNEDTACVKKCVAAGAKYVLEWGGRVMQLDHQEWFAKYAGWVVEIEGTRHGDSIAVKSVKPMLHNNF